eukprot:1764374-Alexandrium_andersonii.AAC.1
MAGCLGLRAVNKVASGIVPLSQHRVACLAGSARRGSECRPSGFKLQSELSCMFRWLSAELAALLHPWGKGGGKSVCSQHALLSNPVFIQYPKPVSYTHLRAHETSAHL